VSLPTYHIAVDETPEHWAPNRPIWKAYIIQDVSLQYMGLDLHNALGGLVDILLHDGPIIIEGLYITRVSSS